MIATCGSSADQQHQGEIEFDSLQVGHAGQHVRRDMPDYKTHGLTGSSDAQSAPGKRQYLLRPVPLIRSIRLSEKKRSHLRESP